MSLSSRLSPGSLLWLILHEIRMVFLALGRKNKPRSKIIAMIWKVIELVFYVFLHVGAWAALFLNQKSPITTELMSIAVMGVVVFTASIMLSASLRLCIQLFFERGDLELLLSSPIRSVTIIQARILGIAGSMMVLPLYLLTPLAHVGLFMGQANWMSIYLIIPAIAILTTSIALLITLGLIRVFGVRRSLTISHIFGAIIGAAFFLATQAPNFLSRETRHQITVWWVKFSHQYQLMDNDHWIWMPARALQGDGLALFSVCLMSTLSFFAITKLTHSFFVTGVQEAAATGVVARKKSNPNLSKQVKFSAGFYSTLIRKEWRTILRDPKLISSMLMRMLYMLPTLFIIAKSESSSYMVIFVVIMMISMLAGSLTLIMVSGEEAPDLLMCCPRAEREILIAKVWAVLTPILVLSLPIVAYLAYKNWFDGIIVFVCLIGAVSSIVLNQLFHAQPIPRDQFNKPKNGRGNLFEIGLAFIWGGIGALASKQYLEVLILVVVAVILLGISYAMKKELN